MGRYSPDDLQVLSPAEQERWLVPLGVTSVRGPEVRAAWPRVREALAWELLYRCEPDLYDRLVAGERIHPDVVRWMPEVDHAVEVGAGSGRFTVDLARRAAQVMAVEPAAPLRDRLRRRLREHGLRNVEVLDGFFDAVPLPGGMADLVVACSAFTVEPEHGGERGLREMERLCRPGGIVAVVWPDDPAWLAERGYAHEVFEGELRISFDSLDEAVEIARIFYPHVAETIRTAGSREVPYDLLGSRGPRDLSWRRMPA